MNSHQIHSFLTVAKTQSINKAAIKLFISPQALHQQLDRMEEELGFKILIRTKKGCYLTPAGKIFYDGMKSLNDQYSQLIKKARENADIKKERTIVTLSTGTFNDLLFSQILDSFHRTHPDIKVIFQQFDPDKLKTADLVFGDVPLKFKVLHEYLLQPKQIYAVYSQSTQLPNKQSLTWDDLQNFPLLVKNKKLLQYLLPDFYKEISKTGQLHDALDMVDSFSVFNKSNYIFLSYGEAISKTKNEKQLPIDNTDFGIYLYSLNDKKDYLKDYINLVIQFHKSN